MRILIADKVSKELVSSLEKLGATVRINPELTDETLPDAVGDASILIVRSTKVTAETIDSAPHLSLIVRAGAGVNTIDLSAASKRGIYVSNCPGMNTAAVAELAIGLLISADRGIADATIAMRSGRWDKKRFGKARGLKGRTLGIVGLGQIGLAVANRATGLGMKVLCWSRSLSQEKAETLGMERAETLLDLARNSDAITVHVAATKDTKRLINKDFFSAMRPGSIFINTSRGDVIDSAALADAIASKGVRAGLDVFEGEPAEGQAPFEQTELAAKLVCTPHIGASTDQAEEAIANEVVNIVKAYSQSGRPTNVVNLRQQMTDHITLTVRHYNRVGVLARVLDMLRDEGINIEEMQNSIFQTNETACCSLSLDKIPTPSTVQRLNSDNDIIEISS
jgi:D-3-phosphoglycerate dehydrogenase